MIEEEYLSTGLLVSQIATIHWFSSCSDLIEVVRRTFEFVKKAVQHNDKVYAKKKKETAHFCSYREK